MSAVWCEFEEEVAVKLWKIIDTKLVSTTVSTTDVFDYDVSTQPCPEE